MRERENAKATYIRRHGLGQAADAIGGKGVEPALGNGIGFLFRTDAVVA